MDENLLDIRDLKAASTIDTWQTAFDAVSRVAKSNKKLFLRPKLLLLGYAGGLCNEHRLQTAPDHIISFTTGVEMQHLFMLVHDDVMDNATMRRGEETLLLSLSRLSTLNNKKSEIPHLANVVGDLLFTRSMRLMLAGAINKESNSAVDIILSAAEHAGAAQFEEISGSTTAYVNSEILTNILSDKTALTGFVAPLTAGIRLAHTETKSGFDRALERACFEWGTNFGLAFQGLQSLSAFLQNSIHPGTDYLQEFQSGRMSLPLLVLRNAAADEDVEDLWRILSEAVTFKNRVRFHDLVIELRLVEKSLEIIEAQIDAAVAILDTPEIENKALLREGLDAFNNGLKLFLKEVRSII